MPEIPGKPTNYPENSNTSHLVCNALPPNIQVGSPFNPTTREIEILNPTAGDGNSFPTSYRFVRENFPALWAKYGNSVDLILHLGIADGWQYITCERGAWKEGTTRPGPAVNPGLPGIRGSYQDRDHEWPVTTYGMTEDQDMKTVEDLDPDQHPWATFPSRLLVTGYDIDSTVDDTNAIINKVVNGTASTTTTATTTTARPNPSLPPSQIYMMPHADPGGWLCGFITYESLAIKRRGNYKALTGFCHMPGWRSVQGVQKMRDVILAFVGAVMGGLEKGVMADEG